MIVSIIAGIFAFTEPAYAVIENIAPAPFQVCVILLQGILALGETTTFQLTTTQGTATSKILRLASLLHEWAPSAHLVYTSLYSVPFVSNIVQASTHCRKHFACAKVYSRSPCTHYNSAVLQLISKFQSPVDFSGFYLYTARDSTLIICFRSYM